MKFGILFSLITLLTATAQAGEAPASKVLGCELSAIINVRPSDAPTDYRGAVDVINISGSVKKVNLVPNKGETEPSRGDIEFSDKKVGYSAHVVKTWGNGKNEYRLFITIVDKVSGATTEHYSASESMLLSSYANLSANVELEDYRKNGFIGYITKYSVVCSVQ